MPYCGTCDRYFNSESGLWKHRIHSSRHNFCVSCERDFGSYQSLRQHYIKSTLHNYCDWCDDDYDTASDLEEHNDDEHEWCEGCHTLWRDRKELNEHIEDTHWYCSPCDRFFKNENNLNQHLNSSTHKLKSYICPGRDCGRGFISWSALILHVEGGSCPSGLNRRELNKLVIRYDRNNLITNPSRLITGPTGTQRSVTRTIWATERSWNGSAYECFLCHNEFRTLDSLNRHLQSPRHEDRIYRCPNVHSCGAEYSALSSLTQHVENGRCGVSRFREVRDVMESLTGQIKALRFH